MAARRCSNDSWIRLDSSIVVDNATSDQFLFSVLLLDSVIIIWVSFEIFMSSEPKKLCRSFFAILDVVV